MTDTAEVEGSPLDELEGEKPSRRGRIAAITAGAAVLVLGGAYVAAVMTTADQLPREAVIAGVDVSGQSSQDAVATLTEALGSRTTEPIAITVGEIEASIDPEVAGLTFDPAASVEALTGSAWNPSDLYTRLLGSVEADAVTAVDAAALDTALAEAESFVDVPPVDATIVFAGEEAVVTDPADGNALDRPAAVEVLTREWLTAQAAIELPIVVVAPALDQAAVDAAMTSFVDPLLSGPVTVTVGEASAQLDVATLAGAATVTGQDGAFALALDEQKIAEAVTTALPDVGQASTDATFTFADGNPQIVPSQDGTGIDPAQLTGVVQAAATSTSERTAAAELVTAEADFSTADAEASGVVEVIGEFSTPLPSGNDAVRTGNIAEGARRATGTFLKPGETFSLIKTIGPISGYDDAGVVVNGRLDKASGGGLSQLSTTLFNAAFEAGLEDTQHRPHTRFYERYPEGREATVWETGGPDEVDMQFTNNTEHGVLVQAWVADGRAWARVWGTKTFDTEIVTGGRYNGSSPRTIYDTSSACRPESGGVNGFSVDVTRTVTKLDGTPVESKDYSWTYVATNRIVCGPDPATIPPPAPAQPEAPPAEG